MSNPTIESVNQILQEISDPETGRSIVRTKQLKDTRVENNDIHITI